jgi:hypothetical protein
MLRCLGYQQCRDVSVEHVTYSARPRTLPVMCVILASFSSQRRSQASLIAQLPIDSLIGRDGLLRGRLRVGPLSVALRLDLRF